eukprot:TRINITY_DN11737_c0_g1_i1.p1 TRINITY_DN11737_c0_g1~~TRINITY_DN11737_c0_g1_i1.p1  ORF type:complete len:621 (+),score=115.38 TRINITY_DN11737_c0_g1_i1:39-1865(+)
MAAFAFPQPGYASPATYVSAGAVFGVQPSPVMHPSPAFRPSPQFGHSVMAPSGGTAAMRVQAPALGASGYGAPLVSGPQSPVFRRSSAPNHYLFGSPSRAPSQGQAGMIITPRVQVSGQGQAVVQNPYQRVSSTPNLQANALKICKTISELLKNRDVLKRAVVQCFKRADDGEECLDLKGLIEFRKVLSQVLQVPNEAFGDLQNEFLCFDFDGSGSLEVNEVYKLVKFHLRQYRKELGGEATTVDMPFMTMQQAGFTVYKELGRGSQGVAKLAKDKSGNEVCVKCLQKNTMSAGGIEEMQEEFQTLQDLQCDAIAMVFEIFQDSQCYYMVGEPYHGGDLMTLKQKARAQKVDLTEDWWRNLLMQACEGLEFMHEQAMMHCDIKEPNIMLKTNNMHDPQLVYIDFGVCKAMVHSPNGMPGGTPGYMPPETILQRKWFPRGDVFCLGVTFLQVLIDKMPPTGPRTTATPGGIFVEGCQTVQDIFNATRSRAAPLHLVPKSMQGLRSLFELMLDKNIQNRPTASQVLGDSWFLEASGGDRKMRSRNDWATVGITKSFLARSSVGGDDESVSPAVKALHQLRKQLDSQADGPNDAVAAEAHSSSSPQVRWSS